MLGLAQRLSVRLCCITHTSKTNNVKGFNFLTRSYIHGLLETVSKNILQLVIFSASFVILIGHEHYLTVKREGQCTQRALGFTTLDFTIVLRARSIRFRDLCPNFAPFVVLLMLVSIRLSFLIYGSNLFGEAWKCFVSVLRLRISFYSIDIFD